jgi:hypothetical protein
LARRRINPLIRHNESSICGPADGYEAGNIPPRPTLSYAYVGNSAVPLAIPWADYPGEPGHFLALRSIVSDHIVAII